MINTLRISYLIYLIYSNNKVADLNIFSSSLPIPKMVEKTLGGEGCQDEGDFLKWSQAEWTLVGQVGYFQFLRYFLFDPGFPGYCC